MICRRSFFAVLCVALIGVVSGPWAQEPPLEEQGSVSEYRTRMDATIKSQTLTPLPETSGGTLKAATSGFGLDSWRGTSKSFAEEKLSKATELSTSLATYQLLRRLLLTEALPPDGMDATEFLSHRQNALVALGASADASALGKKTLVKPSTEADAWVWAEDTLRQGDLDSLCAEIPAYVRLYSDIRWAKALIVCQVYAADVTAAGLGSSLLQETHPNDKDPLFHTLVDVIVRDDSYEAPTDLASLSPLHIGLMQAGKLPFPDEALDVMAPSLLAFLATSSSTSPSFRFKAALKAALNGLAPDDTLLKSVSEFKFRPRNINESLTSAMPETQDRADAMALWHHGARTKRSPEDKIVFLNRLMDAFQGAELSTPVTDLVLSVTDKIPPTETYGVIAARVARLYYARGFSDKGRSWHDLAIKYATSHPDALSDTAKLWPLAVTAGIPDVGHSLYVEWIKARPEGSPSHAPLLPFQIEDIKLITEALASPVDSLFAPSPEQADSSSFHMKRFVPPSEAHITDATLHRYVAKAVLLILEGFKPHGPRKAAAPTVAHGIKALRVAGLRKDAQAIAREALLPRLWSVYE